MILLPVPPNNNTGLLRMRIRTRANYLSMNGLRRVVQIGIPEWRQHNIFRIQVKSTESITFVFLTVNILFCMFQFFPSAFNYEPQQSYTGAKQEILPLPIPAPRQLDYEVSYNINSHLLI